MKPLLQELKLLEEGVDGVKAGIVVYCGDNLELNNVGMFRRVFSSGHMCRYCVINYTSLNSTDGSIKV